MTAPEMLRPKTCKCAERVNDWLRQYNSVIVSNLLSPITRATIAVCKRVDSLQAKLPILEASYCPFCGAKYPGVHRAAGEKSRRHTVERLRELIDYEPKTGAFVWKTNRRGGARIGKTAGKSRPDGYVQIRVEGRHYLAHRLAFLWMTGDIPAIIDHRNGNPSDNRFSNLRPATPRQNSANCRIHSNSKTGWKGVEFVSRSRNWRATIRLADGRRKALGHYKSPEEAHEAYKRAATTEFGEFARFK